MQDKIDFLLQRLDINVIVQTLCVVENIIYIKIQTDERFPNTGIESVIPGTRQDREGNVIDSRDNPRSLIMILDMHLQVIFIRYLNIMMIQKVLFQVDFYIIRLVGVNIFMQLYGL